MLSWLQNSYVVTELDVSTNYMMKTLFMVKIAKLLKWKTLNEARSFYEASLRHLMKKFPVENILWCCKVLHPDWPTSNSSLRGNVNTWQDVSYYISKCWQTNRWMEPILSWGHKGGMTPVNYGKLLRIDYYWSKIKLMKDGMGHTKYPTMVSIVKAVLTLAHGNADGKKKLSDSGKTVKTVTVDRTRLSKAFINNLQIATDGSKVFGSLPHHGLITSSFINLGQ